MTQDHVVYPNPSLLLISNVDGMSLDRSFRKSILDALTTQQTPIWIDTSKFQPEEIEAHCFAYIADRLSPLWVLWESPNYYQKGYANLVLRKARLPNPVKGIIILHTFSDDWFFRDSTSLVDKQLYWSVVTTKAYYSTIARMKELYGDTRICIMTSDNFKSYVSALIALRYKDETLQFMEDAEPHQMKNWDTATIFIEGLSKDDTPDTVLQKIKKVFELTT